MRASFVLHDTWKILSADAEAFALFRATPDQLIGAVLLDLISDTDLKWLVDLRMQIARKTIKDQLPPVDLIFNRFDGTSFFAHVTTLRSEKPGEWESQIDFKSDY